VRRILERQLTVIYDREMYELSDIVQHSFSNIFKYLSSFFIQCYFTLSIYFLVGGIFSLSVYFIIVCLYTDANETEFSSEISTTLISVQHDDYKNLSFIRCISLNYIPQSMSFVCICICLYAIFLIEQNKKPRWHSY
jgi:hypothetical protein